MDRFLTQKLMSAYFLYECGRAMYFVLITWFLYQWTDNALYTGLLVSFGFVPGLFSNLIFGVIIDRGNRKRLAGIAGLLSACCLLGLWSTFFFGWMHLWIFISSHMIMQTLGSLFRPSLQALVAEVYPKESLPRIFSWSNTATITGSLTGASSGGLLAGLVTMNVSIAIVLFLYTAGWIAVTRLAYQPLYERGLRPPSSFLNELKGGFIYVHANRMLYGLFVMTMIGQLTFHTTLGFLSVYTSEHLQQDAFVYGLLDSVFSIGGITAGVLGTWWWSTFRNRLGIMSLLLMAAGLLIVVWTQQVWVSFIGFFLIGLSTSFVRALLQSIQQMVTDADFHGRMSSLRMLCNQTSVVVTGPIFGLIAEGYGVRYVFLMLGIPVVLGIVWSVIQSKHPAFLEITAKQSA
ncbi:MFS transporter [Halobacillus sp. ACCC02827]|uniref:MFS transporter n=1 Tax=Bacillaceae TaxID=186817 RepID=UPI0004025FE0|nr:MULTISPECIES: MFS transporter [Bacillaceae]QHT45298.1 MFS transporter [Bacillus sp. SB49]WJE16081.1 MFS transporter [Halobacillus sp. ACCC02827]